MNTAVPKQRMGVPEFIAWAMAQPGGRYELVDGEIVAMAPERVRHNLVKAAAYSALNDAVKSAGLPCTVFTDGVAVVINEDTVREPDASVQCGVTADLDSVIIDAPVIVVEVASPSSERQDLDLKLVDYFSVPSIRHYVIVLPEKGTILHHEARNGGNIATRIVRAGDIVLDPPGMKVSVAALLGPAGAGAQEAH